MKRNVKRWGAWIMALVMLCSLVMVPAGKVEAAAVSVDLNPETGSKTATVDATGNVELRFTVPSEYNTTDKLKAAGINKLEVTFKVTSYSAAGSGTAGAQAFLGHGESWSPGGSWQNLEAGKEITSTLDLSSFLSSSESIYAYGIQFANLSGSLTYEIVSAKLTGPGTWDVENDNVSLSYTSQNQYNSYIEYKFTVKNSGSTAVSGDLVVTFDQTREKNWWTEDFSISLSGNTLTVSNISIEAGANSKSIQVQLKPIGANITSVSFAGKTISAEETKLSDSGSSGGSESSDDYTGSLTYTVPDDCKDDATTTPFAQHGALHVDSNTLQLTDAQYEYVSYDSIKKERDILNANAVRMAMYTDEYNGYTTGGDTSKLKYRVDKGVQCATSLGMYAIVDWHILNKNPKDYVQQAKEFFEYVSKRYAENDHVLYEICNEPSGGIWSDTKSYAEQIIPIIRANDPDAIIIVGTPTWSQDVDIAMNDPLKDSDGTLMDNVMYTVHFYANEHRQPYRDKVEKAKKTIPIFCTEFGTCAADGNKANDFNEAKAWLDYLDANCISYFVWSLCEKNETASLIVSGSSAWSNWTAANLSESGKWIKEQYAARKDVNNTVSTDPIAVTGVTLNKETLEMVVGETETLKATLKLSNATEKGLSWKSSNETVATVDGNGMVTAVASGETTITVTTVDGAFKATCKVTVNKSTPTIEGEDAITVDYGTALKDIDLSGYKAVIDNTTVEGTFNWENGEITVSTETENKAYKLLFQPTDGTKYETANKSITVKGQKVANNGVPDKPELESKTATSVTLKPYSGTEKIQYGYKDVSGEYTWVDSNEITGLDEWTKYEFALHFAETATTKEGQAGDSITVITNLKDIYKVDLGKLSEEGYIEAHDGSISYDESAKILTLEDADTKYTLTGDGSEITIKVRSSAQENMPNIILEDVTAKGIDADKDLTLGLIGKTTVKNAGIIAGGTLTIDNAGTTKVGTLDVEGENFGAILADNVIVKGGNINATGKKEAVAIKASTKIELVGGAVTANAETQPVIQAGDGTEQNTGEIIWDGCAVKSASNDIFSPNPKKSDGTEIKDICNVIYEGGKTFTVPKGEEITINESVPVKKGFHAKGWKVDSEEDVLEIGKKIKITKDITLVPAYDEIEGELSIVQDTTVAPLVEGYTKDNGVAVTIVNNTNVTFEDIKLAIDSNDFELDEDKLEQLKDKDNADGNSRTIYVKLKNGKKAGDYKTNLTVTIASGELEVKNETIIRTVKATEKPNPDDSDKDPGQNPGGSGEVDPGKDPNKPAEEKPNGSGGQSGGSGTGATGNTPPQTPAAPSAADEVKATGIQVTADVKKADNMLVAGTMKLAPKKKMQLNVAFLPEDADEEEVTFTSSNPKVAIVDEDGEITAGKNPGKTTITVKTESGLVKSFQIQVMKKAVTKVKLQVKTKNLKVGKTIKVKATLSPNKKLASNIIYWTSSNEDVVTVTQKGVIKGLKKGKAKITAVAADGSGKKATVTIKVK